MMLGTVQRVGADGVYVKLQGAGSYDVLAKHYPPGTAVDDLVALDDLKAQPGEHVIVAVLAT